MRSFGNVAMDSKQRDYYSSEMLQVSHNHFIIFSYQKKWLSQRPAVECRVISFATTQNYPATFYRMFRLSYQTIPQRIILVSEHALNCHLLSVPTILGNVHSQHPMWIHSSMHSPHFLDISVWMWMDRHYLVPVPQSLL